MFENNDDCIHNKLQFISLLNQHTSACFVSEISPQEGFVFEEKELFLKNIHIRFIGVKSKE